MTQDPANPDQLVPLDEAERLCHERAGMSAAQFRHELAEHVRGNGGLAWVATATKLGVCRTALEERLRQRTNPPPREAHDEQRT
ncbi:MAG TPA: hypothetical protein VM695_06225 [Phycisphaerae bacterium]|jgi:hypothetical protein|nr:hypothetical protein [Phycisphaerae bacterium]